MPELKIKISGALEEELFKEGQVIVNAMKGLGWIWLGSMVDMGEGGYRELDFSKRTAEEENILERKVGLYRDEEWMRKQYLVEKRSMANMAEECRCSEWTIWEWLRRFGISGRDEYEQAKIIRSKE